MRQTDYKGDCFEVLTMKLGSSVVAFNFIVQEPRGIIPVTRE